MRARDRRALLLGAGVIAAAVLVLRVVPWAARGVGALRQVARERVETLARAQEVLASRSAVRDSLTVTLQQLMALAPKLAEGATGAEAQAALASLVSLAASRHQLRVLRLDPLPDSVAGAFGRVAVHAELEGDVSGLARFLRAIETADQVLTVRSLVVLAPEPNGRPGTPETLRIEADVASLYLARGER